MSRNGNMDGFFLLHAVRSVKGAAALNRWVKRSLETLRLAKRPKRFLMSRNTSFQFDFADTYAR